MPLPAALLARLEKRGIVKAKEPQRPGFGFGGNAGRPSDETEEVFAEDYDDLSQPSAVVAEVPQSTATIPPVSEVEREMEEEEEEEIIACPNKSNPYHECVPYCKERYGIKTFNPDSVMNKRRDRMLRKYPLPDNWQEVADIETDRYYYWNKVTDEVSWLAPHHPKAHITVSAKILQDLVKSKMTVKLPLAEKAKQQEKTVEKDSDDEMDFEQLEEDLKEDKRKKERKSRKRKEKELDPMDPASYSDVPRGNWSTGLERRGEAKTGVDVTASGPLFQQRPYPSPGAILRANKAAEGE